MDPLTVALDLHCYECGRDVHLEYRSPVPVPQPAARPISARFLCPHCTHLNEIDLPGPIVIARGPVALSP